MSDSIPTLQSVRELEDSILADARKLAEWLRALPPQRVDDYTFTNSDGTVSLSDCFGDKEDLILIHNMGRHCSYCMMWADGYNGIRAHLESRAGLVLVSPDPWPTLKEFAEQRDWQFAIASVADTTFNKDMGMEREGSALPGISTFHRDPNGVVTRIASEQVGPFDLFCSTWHLMARLKDGVNDWEPQERYD